MTDSKLSKEKISDATEAAVEDGAEDELPLSFCHACLTPFEDFYYLGEKYGFALIGCLKCGSAVADPYPNTEFMEKFYTQYKPNTPAPKNGDKLTAKHTKLIATLMKKTKGKRFLSVGCGYGFAAIAASELGLEAFGIDTEEKPVKIAKKSLSKDHFDLISLEDYAKAGHQADIIYIEHGTERSTDPNAFIEAAKKVLAPGGVLYLETPDGNHFMIPSNFTRWKLVKPPAILHYFSRKGVKSLLERHGFQVEKFFFSFRPQMKVIAHIADKK